MPTSRPQRNLVPTLKRRLPFLVLAALPLLATWFLLVGRYQITRCLIERRYKAAGYQMKAGCNGAWANQAMFELWAISNRINEAHWAPVPDTNELARLRQEYLATQKELAFRDEDCRKRGHAGTIPVKITTNSSPK